MQSASPALRLPTWLFFPPVFRLRLHTLRSHLDLPTFRLAPFLLLVLKAQSMRDRLFPQPVPVPHLPGQPLSAYPH